MRRHGYLASLTNSDLSSRRGLWKAELQKLAGATSLLHVHHYPPGTSKWNKIEPPLFCHIPQTWYGQLLRDRLAVVDRSDHDLGRPES
jgi:hypothetical protein